MSSVMSASLRTAAAATLRRAPATAAVAATGVAARGGVIATGAGARGMATQVNPALKAAYNNVWKSNPVYITYIIGGCVILEFVYGKAGDAIFNSLNRGKQYDDIDWSVHAEEEDEEEEEEEEEEDDE